VHGVLIKRVIARQTDRAHPILLFRSRSGAYLKSLNIRDSSDHTPRDQRVESERVKSRKEKAVGEEERLEITKKKSKEFAYRLSFELFCFLFYCYLYRLPTCKRKRERDRKAEGTVSC
jgi:hypothetical protein